MIEIFKQLLLDNSQEETINFIKKNKKNINNQDNILKNTIGHFACWSWNNIEILKEMINNGLNINIQNKFGWTLLHEAYWQQNLNLINFLLENNANIGIIDIYGKKPIDYLSLSDKIF